MFLKEPVEIIVEISFRDSPALGRCGPLNLSDYGQFSEIHQPSKGHLMEGQSGGLTLAYQRTEDGGNHPVTAANGFMKSSIRWFVDSS
jgi:hypothetical protein